MISQVELIEEAVELARQVGYEIREDWLTGDGSGHCLVRGRKLLLLDQSEPRDGQLAALQEALCHEDSLNKQKMSLELAEYLRLNTAA